MVTRRPGLPPALALLSSEPGAVETLASSQGKVTRIKEEAGTVLKARPRGDTPSLLTLHGETGPYRDARGLSQTQLLRAESNSDYTHRSCKASRGARPPISQVGKQVSGHGGLPSIIRHLFHWGHSSPGISRTDADLSKGPLLLGPPHLASSGSREPT